MDEPLTFELYKELQGKLEATGAPLSEYNFPNLFFFRHKHEYRYKGDVIEGKSYDGRTFYLPLKADFHPEKGTYFPIPDEWVERFPGGMKEERLEDSDYLFKKETLTLLPGRHRAPRRNQIAQFERDHPFAEIHPLEEEKIPLVLGLLDEWKKDHPNGDAEEVVEALKYMDAFDLEGLIVQEGNEAAAFAIFSQQNSDILMVHFAKALTRFKGSYPFLLRALAKGTSFPWINLEQDLGLPGLRQDKEAFGPDILKKKWWISFP